ncbi:MAG TPA: hypothetical protein VFS43_32405 [Polyangiaceae bacterium]|nr:hypothetical protein [Polyangiaceae bacterium]
MLDEPTNDLDLLSIEPLADAPTSFRGALVVVSHDEALAGATTTVRWEVADGGVSAM